MRSANGLTRFARYERRGALSNFMDRETSHREKPLAHQLAEGSERSAFGFFDFDPIEMPHRPDIADLKPTGRNIAKDLLETYSVSLPVMKKLFAFIGDDEIIDTDSDGGGLDGGLRGTEVGWHRAGCDLSGGAFGFPGMSKCARWVGWCVTTLFTHLGGSAGKACYADL
jgi:hypothetical protein